MIQIWKSKTASGLESLLGSSFIANSLYTLISTIYSKSIYNFGLVVIEYISHFAVLDIS